RRRHTRFSRDWSSDVCSSDLFFNRLAIDMEFGGIATEEAEGERIAASIGNHSSVMMANHGVTTVAPTVAEAFDAMYHLERAARRSEERRVGQRRAAQRAARQP